MKSLALIALLAALTGCSPAQCPPSTVLVDGQCVQSDQQDAGKSPGAAIVAAMGLGPCRTEGASRCTVGSESGRQRCVAGQWQEAPPCPESEVCQRSGAEIGTCAVVQDRCPELEQGAYCEGSLMHACEAGAEASSQRCGSPELCEAGRANGTCPTCLEGEFRCRGPRLESCGLDGTWALESVCETDANCNAATGDCGSAAAGDATGRTPSGASNNQMCKGSSMQKCGDCGMQSRTCDMSTGQWSEWSQCSGEGVCSPRESRTCGMGGTQSCGSDCQWPEVCSGQECSGPLVQRCGRCGTQTRTCDTDTGMLSAWSVECQGQGACTPGMFQGCGPNRVQACTALCSWGLCDTCVRGFTDCSGTCVALASDPRHCGSCTAAPCGPGQRCTGGRCACPDGKAPCFGQCCAPDEMCLSGGIGCYLM